MASPSVATQVTVDLRAARGAVVLFLTCRLRAPGPSRPVGVPASVRCGRAVGKTPHGLDSVHVPIGRSQHALDRGLELTAWPGMAAAVKDVELDFGSCRTVRERSGTGPHADRTLGRRHGDSGGISKRTSELRPAGQFCRSSADRGRGRSSRRTRSRTLLASDETSNRRLRAGKGPLQWGVERRKWWCRWPRR
jgi:hypothetical protein